MKKQYTEENIYEAFDLVAQGLSIRKAALERGVPIQTLRDRLNGRQQYQTAQEKHQRLSVDQERHLAHWVAIQAALGLPPSHKELRYFAQEILALQGDTQPLGKRWVAGFLKRNPEIQVHRAKRMEFARTKSASTAVI